MRSYPTQHADFDDPQERPTLPALTSEIAERLREMEEVKNMSSTRLLGCLFRLSCQSIPAYRLVLACITDGASALQTYQEQAEARGVSRQAVHQEQSEIIEAIRAHMPEVADHIERLRHGAHGNYKGHAA